MDVNSNWLAGLADEDTSFIRNLLLTSGSLKEIAKILISEYKKLIKENE